MRMTTYKVAGESSRKEMPKAIRGQVITLSNGTVQVSFLVRDVRRGMSGICSDPLQGFCDPPSYDGYDGNGRVTASWFSPIGETASYHVYTHDGHHLVGKGFAITGIEEEQP